MSYVLDYRIACSNLVRHSVPEAKEPANLSRSLTGRFENLKTKYRRELETMIADRQVLQREIQELKQAKEACLEETTVLVSRNDELHELNMSMTRQLEQIQSAIKTTQNNNRKASKATPLPPLNSAPTLAGTVNSAQTSTPISSTSGSVEEKEDAKYLKGAKSDSEAGYTMKKFPWFKGKENSLGPVPPSKPQQTFVPPPVQEKPKLNMRHNFQQQSVLRFARCDYCGDKMWGTQLRCSSCSIAVHTRCTGLINTPCRETAPVEDKDIVEIKPLRML